MMIVYPLALENLAPWRARHVFAAIFLPVDLRMFSKNTRFTKRANVQPNTVVQIRLPTDRLFFDRLPTHENIVRLFAFNHFLQLRFEFLRRLQTRVTSFLASVVRRFLPRDPITEKSVRQFLKIAAIQFMIINQRAETIPSAIPD